MPDVITTACPLDCPDGCSLAVTIQEGRIVKIDADTGATANPFTQGYICQKVKHHARRVYAPERVLTPLIRTGPKGSGEFRPAGWDEASRLVAAEIRDSIRSNGVDSVVAYLYSSSAGVFASQGLTPLLFERLGCSEVEHTICAATVGAAWNQVFGSMLGADPFDLVHSKLVVVWGANPNASNTHLLPLITKAVKTNGAKLVVVDPRRTGVAARADLHLAIRPGTDVVLAYAVARWLVENNRHDTDFLAANADGVEAFISAAQEWTIDRAAAECGVDPADIEQFAALVATVEPAMVRLGWGLERNRNGGSGCVGVLSLWALAREDLFTVVHEQVLTDTAMYADVVLPCTTHFEAADLVNAYGSFSLLRIQPVIDRVGESRSNDELAALLAAELGLPPEEFDPDPERLARALRTDHDNASLPSIRKPGTTVQFVDTRPGFDDGSGRARLADPSSELPLPKYEPARTGRLTLLSPSTNRTINSMFAEFDPPDVVASINPADAQARDIAEGNRVRVFNELGEIELNARLDAGLRRGVVSIPKGLWRRHFDSGFTANSLIPREVNDLASGACFNDAQVEIEAVATH